MMFYIEMVLDLVCLWCWVGLWCLKGVMVLVLDLDVEVLFCLFELDLIIFVGGMDYKVYMKFCFGLD